MGLSNAPRLPAPVVGVSCMCLMRNFLNSFPCHLLRGSFKCGSLFMSMVVAQRLESTSTAFSLSCRSLSNLWYSLCEIGVKLFTVAARRSFSLQVRAGSQFRVTQAQGFCANLLALTITSKWIVKRYAFANPCCRR
jgi:hypothetical protein